MEMLPDPALTVMTCWDAELVGTVTTRPPEAVLAFTRYRVLPRGSTSETFPEPVLTRTCAGTSVKVRVISPDPALAVTLALANPATEMLPEPVLTATFPPDTALPDTSPDPVSALTGPDRSASVTLREPVEMSARLPPGTTAWKSNEQLPATKWHRGVTVTPDRVSCQVTVDRMIE